MISLDEVKSRCIIDSDDIDSCWLFQGAAYEGLPRIHAPNYTRDPTGQTLTTQGGRRAVWHIQHAKAFPKGWRTWSTCDIPGCVNPAHIGAGGLKAYGLAVARSGKYRQVPKRMLANQRNSGLQRKVTREVADAILASNDDNHTLAARHGLHHATVSRVRNGHCQVPGNFFQGLMK